MITEAHNGARRKIIDDCCPPETLPGIGEGRLAPAMQEGFRQRARLTSEQLTTVDLLLPPVCM